MITFCTQMIQRHTGAVVAAMMLCLGMSSTVLLGQQKSVVDSLHNLSASGPGTIRAVSEQEVCIFCHASHHASAVQPLWNRQLPVGQYSPYRSNSLQALPDQPTGSSKLCLSCHDGTIALGSVVSRSQPIQMANNVIRLPAGSGNLGTDLSDDHPISFVYDQALLQKNLKLKNPAGLPSQIKLDANKEVQCVTCHDPHDNQWGKFLVISNTASQLCTACHNQGATPISAHANCSACHMSHTAPSGPYLLRGNTVTATCTLSACHGAQAPLPRLNIAADIAKFSKHDTNSPVNQRNHVPDNTVCSDCHEPHTMGNTSASAPPLISPRLGRIDGVSNQNTKVDPAQYQYEVCFKCHGDRATTLVTLKPRQIIQTSKRLQFAPTAVSFHPVEVVGKNADVPSLLAPWTTTSLMYCTDCHASNSSAAGGSSGARGPHGSTNAPVLVASYITADGTKESLSAYALCYKCHDRNVLLSNITFKRHSNHIALTSCSVCHDSHGISSTQGTTTNNSHLINFDTSVVTANRLGQLRYVRLGLRQGSCSLTCHNHNHTDSTYR